MKYRAFLLVGPPGSGKGTLARSLGTDERFFHCSCGDVFRSLDATSPLGRVFQRHSRLGLLVPDQVTVQVWLDYMERCELEERFHTKSQLILLDGMPRNADQARLVARSVEVLGVLQLDHIGRDELMSRIRRRALKEGRSDDAQSEVIERPLQIYEREVGDLLGCLPWDRLYKLDATRSPEDVFDEAVRHLARLMPDS